MQNVMLEGELNIEQLPDPELGYQPEWDRKWWTPALGDRDLPRLTIVTPSFNQGRFIEQTIRCILLQNYPDLEYIIVDGGSTDDSIRIIRKYERWLTFWGSEPDKGMYDALNKGFARSTGEIMGWSPTGDLYVPGALQSVGSAFRSEAQVEWVTSAWKVKIDEQGNESRRYRVPGFSRRAFSAGLYMTHGNPAAKYTIQQQSTFWRRSLWDRSGGRMDDSMKGAGDFELWSRFVAGAELYSIDEPIGVFRTHDGQESVAHAARMREEAQTALRRAGGSCMPLWRAKWSRRFARLASGNPVLERFGFDWKAWWLTKDAQTSSFRRERRSIIP
jgi:hypothetical protein